MSLLCQTSLPMLGSYSDVYDFAQNDLKQRYRLPTRTKAFSKCICMDIKPKDRDNAAHTTEGWDADATLRNMYHTKSQTNKVFSAMVGVVGGQGFRRTLVAFGKWSECVNLLDEVCHTGPPSKSKAHHKNPNHHKCINHIHDRPVRDEER